MQIHELNDFTGTLGSGAYLAIDDGNDTGKISSQDLLAATEARIDNIIAGPAPSAEEIVDARLGADGVTYPSLGDAIRDQFTDVKSELTYSFADEDLWESGSITAASGANAANANRIRTKGYIDKIIDAINPQSGYKFVLYAYTDADVYVGAYNGSTFVTTATWWSTPVVLRALPQNYNYRITLGKTSDTSISASDGVNCKFSAHTDPTVTKRGLSADSKAVRDEINYIKNDINANVDLKVEVIDGEYCPKWGGIASDANACRTNYIPIVSGSTIRTCARANSNVYEIAFFGIDKEFDSVNSILGDSNINTREIVVPDGVYYVIISCYGGNGLYKNVISFARKNDGASIEYTAEAINSYAMARKYSVSSAGGYHNTPNMAFTEDVKGKSTDFIPVYAGQKLTYSTKLNSLGYELIYYSEFKLPLQSLSIAGDSDTSEKEVTVPSYAKYVKLWSYGSFDAYLKCGYENASDDTFAFSGGYNTFAIFRKFVVCGDSLSVGHIDIGDSHTSPNLDYCWGRFIARDYDSECVNCGKSGVSAEAWLTNSDCLTKMQTAGNKGQAYIIGLGANEESGNIGSPSTLNDTTTFYGAYKAIYDAIRAVNATAKIFMLTLPTHWGDEWSDVNEGVRYIAENVGDSATYLVDLAVDEAKYFSAFPIAQTQTTHYLPAGYKMISKILEYALDKVIINNPTDFGNVHLIPYD